MITVKEELLSAFVDEEIAELEVQRLCKELPNDERELARWGRYHLIRDALRANLPARLDVDFAVRVMARIANEPEATAFVRRSLGERLLNPAAGFGLAASVAVAAVLGFNAFTGPSATSPKTAQVVSVPSSAPQAMRPVSVAAAGVGNSARGSSIRNPEVAARLNSYLVNHSEFAPSRGVMPYARVVVGYYETVQP